MKVRQVNVVVRKPFHLDLPIQDAEKLVNELKAIIRLTRAEVWESTVQDADEAIRQFVPGMAAEILHRGFGIPMEDAMHIVATCGGSVANHLTIATMAPEVAYEED